MKITPLSRGLQTLIHTGAGAAAGFRSSHVARKLIGNGDELIKQVEARKLAASPAARAEDRRSLSWRVDLAKNNNKYKSCDWNWSINVLNIKKLWLIQRLYEKK